MKREQDESIREVKSISNNVLEASISNNVLEVISNNVLEVEVDYSSFRSVLF
ncbi:hypothetical protein [Streptococcus pneumoniae]|uniref:hypothetical protein n=1 Tax=Streptococcus pneumoniae TaxID=1313 RepID=UPI0015DA5131|nr:hypothetical protein [Streptococcus pneumoniae]